MRELDIPQPAITDDDSVELARIWAAHGGQVVTINVSAWKDPATWGIMLTDFARHVADSYAQDTGRSREEVLNRIKEGIEAEWNHPTD